MSQKARDGLSPENLRELENSYRIVSSDISMIETIGGGSARCMTIELFWHAHPSYTSPNPRTATIAFLSTKLHPPTSGTGNFTLVIFHTLNKIINQPFKSWLSPVKGKFRPPYFDLIFSLTLINWQHSISARESKHAATSLLLLVFELILTYMAET